MSREKIQTAAQACLNEGSQGFGEFPFARMRAFLYALRADRDWSDAEIMEVQLNVIRVLTSRLAGLERMRSADRPKGEVTGAVNLLV